MMSLPVPLWTIAVGLLPFALAVWMLYEYYLHPAWRKQRRVLRACEKAFDEGEYRLERLRTSLNDPSIADLVPSPAALFGSDQGIRYFTYNIEPIGDAKPDFSGMSADEIGLVKHYLRRNADVPHYGKEVLRPVKNGNPANEHQKAPA